MTMPSSNHDDVISLDRRHVWHPFTQELTAPLPIEIVRGEGAWLFTRNGGRLLDLISSWWVNVHGHCHPALVRALSAQMETLDHVMFAGFTHAPAVELAGRLTAALGLERVFYSDNGSTSVEVSLKIALQYWRNKGESGRNRILAFEGGYHGDTFGAMAVGKSSGFFEPFAELQPSVTFLPYPATWDGDPERGEREAAALTILRSELERAGDIVAILMEPLLQGASGMRRCSEAFVREVATLARAAGVLVVFDEVMTGFGRTGHMFAAHRAGVKPDLICLSKGITGGVLPLGATLCREDIFREFLGETFSRALAHGHSYTANPLACAVGVASWDLFGQENTLEKIRNIERIHAERVRSLPGGKIREPRVMGSVAAFRLESPETGYEASIGRKIRQECQDAGLLLRPLGDVVYLMPPACVSAADLHKAWDVIAAIL